MCQWSHPEYLPQRKRLLLYQILDQSWPGFKLNFDYRLSQLGAERHDGPNPHCIQTLRSES